MQVPAINLLDAVPFKTQTMVGTDELPINVSVTKITDTTKQAKVRAKIKAKCEANKITGAIDMTALLSGV